MLDEKIKELRESKRVLLERNNRYYTEMQNMIPQDMKDKYRAMCIELKATDEELRSLEDLKASMEPVDDGHNEGEIL